MFFVVGLNKNENIKVGRYFQKPFIIIIIIIISH